MASVNKVILVGNLGKDPESKSLTNGNEMVSFSVATSESWTDKRSGNRQERTEWHNVVVFSEALCKVCKSYLHKGSKVYIEGKLQTRKWQDKDGNDRYTTEVVLQGFNAQIVMLGGKNENEGTSRGPEGETERGGSSNPSGSWDDEDIPF